MFDLPGIPSVGSSGHSKCRQFRFSGTFGAIFVGFCTVSPAKDIYVEKFGADAFAIAVLFFAISFFACLCEVLSGTLQNREALRYFFPVEKWGRKAPWLITHMVILAIASAALYLPPTRGRFVLPAWFFVVSLAMYWSIATCGIACQSARQEIYPYNEERSSVEVLSKIACCIGVGYGVLPILVLLARTDLILVLCVSGYLFIGIMAGGLQAAPIWLEAKSASGQDSHSFLRQFRDVWGTPAFRHVFFIRWYEGMYQGLQTSNLLYYLTYVLGLHGIERSAGLVVVGLVNMVADLMAAFVTGWYLMERKNNFSLQRKVMFARIANLVSTACLLSLPVMIAGPGPYQQGSGLTFAVVIFLVWNFTMRGFQSPDSFFRVGAELWVVDEDIHTSGGVRREAAFIGIASAAQNFGRAFAAALAFMGYAVAGLKPLDCESECKLSGSVNECRSSCAARSILMQPEALRWYIHLLNILCVPCLELLLVLHTWAFPIQGIRLAQLYNRQTLALGGSIEEGTAAAQLDALRALASWPAAERKLVELQQGQSKSYLLQEDTNVSVPEIVRRLGRRPGLSASVVLGPPLAELLAEEVTGLLVQEDSPHEFPILDQFASEELKLNHGGGESVDKVVELPGVLRPLSGKATL